MVSDTGTSVVTDNILLGGFNSGIFGGTATLSIQNSVQVTANVETDFFTTTSTLVIDKATLTTPRLGTFDGATRSFRSPTPLRPLRCKSPTRM